jgi:Tfp pilus assembly protein PilF
MSGRLWAGTAALFAALAMGLYANALNNPFHFDDLHGIVENHHLRDPGNIPKFFAPKTGRQYFSPSEPRAIHYRPLLLTSYTANFALGGEGPVGFHLYHVLLHVIGALLLTALGLRLGLPPPWAAGLGVLFLANPFHTEAVNFITGRSSLQSGVLSLAALVAFVRARQGTGQGRLGWLAGAFLLAGAALLTKEVAVTVPLLFFLYDLLYPPPRSARWGLNGYGLDLGLMGAGLAYLVADGKWGYFLRVVEGRESAPRGFGENLWLQAQVLVEFVRLTVMPVGLSVVHDFAGGARASVSAVGCVLVLAAITGAAVALRRRIPLFGLGWGIFVLVLLPTTLLPMNTPLQESRGYAAAAGVMLAAAALLHHLALRAGLGRRWGLAAVVVLVLFCAGTVGRNPVWASDMALWRDAVAKAPGDFRAHANLGAARHAAGDLEGAVAAYRDALDRFSGEAAVHADLGGALMDLGRMDEARASLQEAIRVSDRYAPAHYKYGLLLARSGDAVGARREYERAVELVPSYPEALVNLGILLARGGDPAAGAARMERALAVRPRDPSIYVNLMTAYLASGQWERARALYRKAEAEGAVTPRLTALRRGLGPMP